MEEERCNTRLALGLGGAVDIFAPSNRRRGRQRKPPVQFDILFPPRAREEEEGEERGWQLVGDERGVNRSRLRTPEPEEREGAVDRGSSGEGGGPRKKLRLTKEQSALLESTFTEHNILTPAQKQELADKLNLRSRQVEVWFQNRRARTKLKQTEVDCEILKKCCETLSDENTRLKKELQELRTSTHAGGSPFYVQLPRAATVTMCPSCERIAAGGGNKSAGFEAAVVVGAAAAAPKRGFYDRSTVKDSSMAC